MAILIRATSNFVELALDGVTDFNFATDLVSYGLLRNAPSGLRVSKIIFIPSAAGDQVIVRDGINGPAMFSAINALGTYDILKDAYYDGIVVGKIVKPYIHAFECVVSVVNAAFVIFEL